MAGPGPCTPWVTPAAVSARPDMADANIQTSVIEGACADASGILYALSGRQYPGACTSTVRPHGGGYGCCHVATHLLSGCVTLDSWTAATNGGACGDGGLDLGLYPVRSITQVKVDGQVVAPSAYRLDGKRWLVRLGATLHWPVDQRLDLPDTAVGTFSVTAAHGADPPDAGVSAASLLAAELSKSRSALPNSLPRRVTTIVRQGVTMAVADPQGYLREGLSGIWEIDLFLRAANPGRQTTKPLVWSPELGRRRRVS